MGAVTCKACIAGKPWGHGHTFAIPGCIKASPEVLEKREEDLARTRFSDEVERRIESRRMGE